MSDRVKVATPKRRRHDDAHEVQTFLLLVCTGIYFLYSAQLVEGHVGRTALGASAIAGAYFLARHLGPNLSPGNEPIVMFVGAMLLFIMPVAGGPSPRGHGFVAAAIGSFAAQGSWALWRYPYEPTRQAMGFLNRSALARMLTAGKFGAAMALMLTLLVSVLLGVAAIAAPEERMGILGDFPFLAAGYFSAGIVGGCVIGEIAPIVRWPIGAITLGIPLTGAIYGSVGLAMTQMNVLSEGTDMSVFGFGEALVILTYIGPMWGVMAKEWIED